MNKLTADELPITKWKKYKHNIHTAPVYVTIYNET